MKRGHVAIALVVLLVGVIGVGLLLAEKMSQPTGMPIMRIPVQPIPTQPLTISPQALETARPAGPGPGTCSKAGTTIICLCDKKREILGECSKPLPIQVFYKGTVFKADDVKGFLDSYYGDSKLLCRWGAGHIFEHFVPGKNLCSDPDEQSKQCVEAAKTKTECQISNNERKKTNGPLDLCSKKAKEVCQGAFYQGAVLESTRAWAKP